MKDVRVLGLSLALLLSSCGLQTVATPTQPGTRPISQRTAPNAHQREVAQSKLALLRQQSSSNALPDLNWDAAYTAEDAVYIPAKNESSTIAVSMDSDVHSATKLESFQKNGETYIRMSRIGSQFSQIDRITANGSLETVSQTKDNPLSAQATCAQLRDDIQEHREAAATNRETAMWFGAAGIAALETPPAAAVAAAAAARYKSISDEEQREANRLKKIYTANCA